MPEGLGARLRRHREAQHIALSAIAESTKIGLSLLEGLERDDVARWPSGIFRRAFVRAYANAIGLDADVVLREFLDLHPDPDEVVSIPFDGVAVPLDRQEPAATGFGRLVGTAARGLDRLRSRRQTTVLPSIDAASSAPQPATAPAPTPSESTSGPEERSARPVATTVEWTPDINAAARVCTELGRVTSAEGFAGLIAEGARVLGAAGLIVWLWDPAGGELRPALGHGYADALLSQIPALQPDERNATAAAFRAGEPCVVSGTDAVNGALAVPLQTADGCAGVLAIEFSSRREQNPLVRAIATIFAAQIATLIPERSAAEAARKLA